MSPKQQNLRHTWIFTLTLILLVCEPWSGLLEGAVTGVERALAAVIPAQKRPISNLSHSFKNWGIANLHSDSSIHAIDAWKIEQGNANTVVAVIDTGVDSTHRDLVQNIWSDPSSFIAPARTIAKKNPKKKTGPRGRAEALKPENPPIRIYGWDFVRNQANPADMHGHGTHVAGIIGAVANPKAGISGVAQHVSIMAVKYYSDSNSGQVNLANTVKALEYAINHGARIINYSGGGPERAEDEYRAIKKAEDRGILVVAAAGNERQNSDLPENYYYPAAYGLSNIISVAGTDPQNHLLPSSNWGREKVHVAAPGENIYSTLPGNQYGYMSGTSQATAFVSGLAALLLSKNPKLTPTQLKEIIMNSVDPIQSLAGKVASGGRVNAYRALLTLMNNGRPLQSPGLSVLEPGSLLNQFAWVMAPSP